MREEESAVRQSIFVRGPPEWNLRGSKPKGKASGQDLTPFSKGYQYMLNVKPVKNTGISSSYANDFPSGRVQLSG